VRELFHQGGQQHRQFALFCHYKHGRIGRRNTTTKSANRDGRR
jgi:hypothetical protein